MEVSNAERAQWAGKAVDAFAAACRVEQEDKETILGDLLCDLMHWADHNDVNLEKCLKGALENYAFERQEEIDELEAHDCYEDGDEVESTYCGTMCESCRREHEKDCEMCRKDFEQRGI